MAKLLTETADYNEPGSWGRMSEGWPGIRGDDAVAMMTFANCIQSIPYGSYVLMHRKGKYENDPNNPQESYLRVHADYIDQLKADFEKAGRPSPEVSIARREKYGKLNATHNREAAPLWDASKE
jgi:hypothetical protein